MSAREPYRSKLGEIPIEHWDDDIPHDPNFTVDQSPGSTYDEIKQRVEREREKRRKK